MHNPFATRWVRPGAIDFELPPGITLDELLARFARQGRRGAIVGPHGSGKSTLLATLGARLAAEGHLLAMISLREGNRSLPRPAKREIQRLVSSGPKGPSERRAIVMVDGHEQLGHWARWRLNRLCRRSGLGLLLTSHCPTSTPELVATSPSAELVVALAARLLGAEWSEPYRARAEASYVARRGNVREVLFDLYDLYESRRARDDARDRVPEIACPGRERNRC